MFWHASPNSPPEPVITEVYNSDTFLEEHENFKSQPWEPGCNLETAIDAILMYSDSTHLANFGQHPYGQSMFPLKTSPNTFMWCHFPLKLTTWHTCLWSVSILNQIHLTYSSHTIRYQTWLEMHTNKFSERHHQHQSWSTSSKDSSTPSGSYWWMKSSCMHMSMESL